MPNKQASIKHLRQTVKRTKSNNLVKRNIKQLIKSGHKAIIEGSIKDQHQEMAKKLQKAVDKAVKAGIIKKNTGNRKKARFMNSLNKTVVK
ncbi:MAG: 30S ribosomal protein S20 [Patescibacteria group bacterium]|jgi:ribosomal protein S20